jgi:DNA/RNA endonuclease G (NUC1)
VLLVSGGAHASIGFNNCTDSFVHTESGPFVPAMPARSVEVCVDGLLANAYRPEYRDPAWSAVYVTQEDCRNNIPGRLSFYEDPSLEKAGIAQANPDAEVFGNQWNRGHLVASRLNSYSKAGKKSTYDVVNIAPQDAYFNQQVWLRMETDLFNWLLDNEGGHALHFVIGVAIDERNVTWGPEKKIAIPNYFWCAVCAADVGQSAAFWGFNIPVEGRGGQTMETSKTGRNDLGVGFTSFATVEELQERVSKFGDIFPRDVCNTHVVDQDFWGWSTAGYARDHGATVYGDLSLDEQRALYRKSRALYRAEKMQQQRSARKQQ